MDSDDTRRQGRSRRLLTIDPHDGLPPRKARHARKGGSLVSVTARAALAWLTTARVGTFLRRHSPKVSAGIGVVIILMCVYLIRQGLLVPSPVSLGPSPGAEVEEAAGTGGNEATPPESGVDAGTPPDSATGSEGSPDVTEPPAGEGTSPGDLPVMDFEGQDSVVLGPMSLGECLEGLRGPLPGGTLTRTMGWYESAVFGDWRYHPGVDIAAGGGTNVRAALGGLVVEAATTPAFGGRVVISHGFGLQTVYAHLGAIYVEEGDEVSTGEVIAVTGRPGAAEGDLEIHLHYEVRVDGQPIDPEPYLGQ